MIYHGEWKGNVRWGYGVQVWPDGAKYEGNWENGKANGSGNTHITQASLFTWTVMSMRAAGSMTKLQEKEYIGTTTELSTMGSGSMITSTGREFRRGWTGVSMKVNTSKVKRMDRGNTYGRTAVSMLVTGRIIK